jgi:hypothetical protein
MKQHSGDKNPTLLLAPVCFHELPVLWATYPPAFSEIKIRDPRMYDALHLTEEIRRNFEKIWRH